MRKGAPAFVWSRKLVTIVGIDVYAHVTFLLLIAFVAFGDLLAGRGPAVMARSLLFIAAIFTSVVLHEFGHALTARRFGIRTKEITLLPIGGVARLEGMPDEPRHQLLVALAGPTVNVGIALFLFVAIRLTEGPFGFEDIWNSGGSFLVQLMWINMSLAAFNLLPGYPMDGGRILRAILAMGMEPERSTKIAARVGQVFALMLGLVGLFMNPFLVVIALFVWLGAQSEHTASSAKIALTGLSVRHAMITEFKTISPRDPLSRAVELTVGGFQQHFPVMDGARLVGVLTHNDLLASMAGHPPNISVQYVMRTQLETASPSEGLDLVLTRMQQSESSISMVVDDERVVGLLTIENIAELLLLKKAAGRDVHLPRVVRSVP